MLAIESFKAPFHGREKELEILNKGIYATLKNNGSTFFLSGPTGIGKSSLVSEFLQKIETREITVRKVRNQETQRPFQLWLDFIGSGEGKELMDNMSITSFSKVLVVDRAGLLIAQAESGERDDIDPDIFAGMMSAVQNFVRDSFSNTSQIGAGLGRLEYGDMTILIENGKGIFFSAIFEGPEHQDMKSLLKNTIKKIENEHGQILENWKGKLNEVEPIQNYIDELASVKFRVRKSVDKDRLERERIRISDMILNNILAIEKESPLIIVAEDIHMADESSLFVLKYILRNIVEKRIMIICTYDSGQEENLKTFCQDIMAENKIELILLNELDIDYLEKIIVGGLPGPALPKAFIDKLISQSGGNPLLLVEILNHLIVSGCIRIVDDKTNLLSSDFNIPGSIEILVHERVDKLEPGELSLIEYLACMGSDFETRAIDWLPTSQENKPYLDRLILSGLVSVKNEKGVFNKKIFRDVIYQSINQRWASKYHKGLGQYYEEIYWSNLDSVIYELARHYSKTSVHEKTLEYCNRAGEAAENSYSPELAIDYYSKSLEVLEKYPSYQIPHISSSTILHRIGKSLTLIGEFDKAIIKLREAILKEPLLNKKAEIYEILANVYEMKGEYEIAINQCKEAIGLLGDTRNIEKAKILCMSGIIYSKMGEYDKAENLHIDSLNISLELGNKEQTARSKHALGLVFWFRGDLDKALAIFKEAYDIYDSIEDDKKYTSLNNIGVIYMENGLNDKALEIFNKCAYNDRKRGDIQSLAISLGNIGDIHHTRGELDEALDAYDQSLEISQRIGDRVGIAWSMSSLGYLYPDLGDIEKGLGYLIKSSKLNEEIGAKEPLLYDYYGIADIFIKKKKLEEAEKYANKALNLALTLGAKRSEGVSYQELAMIYCERREFDKASTFFNKSKVIFEEIGDDSLLGIHYFEVYRMKKIQGKEKEAETHLRAAESIFKKAGMIMWLKKLNDEIHYWECEKTK